MHIFNLKLTISEEEVETFTATKNPALQNKITAVEQKINSTAKLDEVVKESQASNPEKWAVPVNKLIEESPKDAYAPETKAIYKVIEIVQTTENSQTATLKVESELQKAGITPDSFLDIEINNKLLNKEALQQILSAAKSLKYEIARNHKLQGIDFFKKLSTKLDKAIAVIEKQIVMLDQKKIKAKELYEEELALNFHTSFQKASKHENQNASIAEIIGNFKLESKTITEKLREIRFETRKKEIKELADYVERTEKASMELFQATDKKIKAKNLAFSKEITRRLKQQKDALNQLIKVS